MHTLLLVLQRAEALCWIHSERGEISVVAYSSMNGAVCLCKARVSDQDVRQARSKTAGSGMTHNMST